MNLIFVKICNKEKIKKFSNVTCDIRMLKL